MARKNPSGAPKAYLLDSMETGHKAASSKKDWTAAGAVPASRLTAEMTWQERSFALTSAFPLKLYISRCVQPKSGLNAVWCDPRPVDADTLKRARDHTSVVAKTDRSVALRVTKDRILVLTLEKGCKVGHLREIGTLLAPFLGGITPLPATFSEFSLQEQEAEQTPEVAEATSNNRTVPPGKGEQEAFSGRELAASGAK